MNLDLRRVDCEVGWQLDQRRVRAEHGRQVDHFDGARKKLAGDFATPRDWQPAEQRLLYVAVTRAREQPKLPSR